MASTNTCTNRRWRSHAIISRKVSQYETHVYKLSSRDLVEMMAERGIELAHTTILRWVQRYVPEFEKRWKRYARPVGGSWRMDETYVKVRGEWVYLSSRRQSGQDSGLLFESATGCQRGQSVSA